MAYCEVKDLLLGDLQTAKYDLQGFIDNAANEIDAELGTTYVVPFVTTAMTAGDKAMLRQINAWLATGRLYQAAAAGLQDYADYGSMMIKEARDLLYSIRTGIRQLPSAVTDPTGATTQPPILAVPGDEVSAVEYFYGVTMADTIPTGWNPGKKRTTF